MAAALLFNTDGQCFSCLTTTGVNTAASAQGHHRYIYFARAVVRYMQREMVLAKQVVPAELLPKLLRKLRMF